MTDTPMEGTPLPTPASELPALPHPNAPVTSSGLANPPLTATSPAASPSATTEDVTPVVNVGIPSNAVEMSNTAPGHTEEGQGDLGGQDVHMEVNATEVATVQEMGQAVSEDVAMGEEDPLPVQTDEGLVHGEMDPPRPEMNVEGGDHPPPEVEKE